MKVSFFAFPVENDFDSSFRTLPLELSEPFGGPSKLCFVPPDF